MWASGCILNRNRWNEAKKRLGRLKYRISIDRKLLCFHKCILLLGTEDFGNLGDHHIAISELEFCKHYFPEYKIIEIPASKCLATLPKIQKYVRRTTPLFLHGGGNIGDEYIGEKIRHQIMELFPQNSKIIFPQTVFYKDLDGEDFKRDRIDFTPENHVVLLCREQYSYQFAEKYFRCDKYLVPDIVLFSKKTGTSKRNGVTFCIRQDREKAISEEKIQQLISSQEEMGIQTNITDTQLLYHIPVKQREGIIENFLEDLSSAKVVVTDRLHGMVFSYLTHTPCLAFANYNKKVQGVYEWISKSNYIRFMERLDSQMDIDLAEQYIRELYDLQESEKKHIQLIGEFDKMAEIIKSAMK